MSKHTSRTSGSATEIGLTLEQLIQRGARDLLQNAIEVEVRELLAEYANVRTLSGAAAVVRNGYLPSREILSAVGPVQVRVPKVRDRSGGGGEVQLRAGAALRSALQDDRRGAAVVVSEGYFHR